MRDPTLHYERLTEIHGPFFEAAWRIYAEAIPEATRKSKTALLSMLRRDDYRFLIARRDHAATETVVGMSVLFAPAGEEFGLLEYLAVAPDHRGAGVGGALLAASFEHARMQPERGAMLI